MNMKSVIVAADFNLTSSALCVWQALASVIVQVKAGGWQAASGFLLVECRVLMIMNLVSAECRISCVQRLCFGINTDISGEL